MRRSTAKSAALLLFILAVLLFWRSDETVGVKKFHKWSRFNGDTSGSNSSLQYSSQINKNCGDHLNCIAVELMNLRQSRSEGISVATPSESALQRINEYLERSKSIIRLRAARFALDVELAKYAPDPLGTYATPPLADVGLPEPSSYNCRQMADGFETCEYQNICADVPGPIRDPDGSFARFGDTVSQIKTLYFVGSDVVPSFSRLGQEWPENHSAIASHAPPHCRAHIHALISELPWPRSPLTAECGRWLRHFMRLYPNRRVSIPFRVSRGWNAGFDSVWEDISTLKSFQRERITPFSAPFDSAIVSPNETLSAALGGAYDGIVTWVDNLYVAHNILDAHLWGFSQVGHSQVLQYNHR